MKKRGVLFGWVVLLGWGAAVGIGEWRMADFASRPGAVVEAATRWPDDSSLAALDAAPVVLLFAHPMCPCTRATLAELERVLAHSNGSARADVRIVFVWDDAAAPDWNARGSWDAARAIPGTSVTTDLGGLEARRFGATTSGEVLVYGGDRALRFRGGITAARGHQGDNVGADAVRALLAGATSETAETPVFGCPLFSGSAP
jgi:hypothetical protein